MAANSTLSVSFASVYAGHPANVAKSALSGTPAWEVIKSNGEKNSHLRVTLIVSRPTVELGVPTAKALVK